MIVTLPITIILEGLAAIGYCRWRRKPLLPILFTSLLANLITQSLLWLLVSTFFQQYLITLLIAELFIWIVEGFLFHAVPANHLDLQHAILLSLGLNLVSFVPGLFLPV